jgi:protein-tyrosine-phosphatase
MKETNVLEKIKTGKQVTYADLANISQVVIEYACTGNSGRSPLAEAIANDFALNESIENRVIAISSGTKRNANVNGVPSIENQLFVLGRAIARNDELKIYSAQEAKGILAMLENPDKTKQAYNNDFDAKKGIRLYDSLARSRLFAEEHQFRERAAMAIGLSIPIKGDGQQTEACDQVDLFYAMAQGNEDQAKEIYANRENQPMFTNFGVANTFGLPYQEYKSAIDFIQTKVIARMNRILEAYK